MISISDYYYIESHENVCMFRKNLIYLLFPNRHTLTNVQLFQPVSSLYPLFVYVCIFNNYLIKLSLLLGFDFSSPTHPKQCPCLILTTDINVKTVTDILNISFPI